MLWLIFLTACTHAIEENNFLDVVLSKYCEGKTKTIFQKMSIELLERGEISRRDYSAMNSGKSLSDLNVEALDDVYNKNKVKGIVGFNCRQLVVLSEAQIEEAFRNKPLKPYDFLMSEEWAGLLEKYPNVDGVLRISMPGYSKDGQYGIIYKSSSCGPQCGNSTFSQYKKINGKWVREKVIFLSVS